jgi:hypothetical protein
MRLGRFLYLTFSSFLTQLFFLNNFDNYIWEYKDFTQWLQDIAGAGNFQPPTVGNEWGMIAPGAGDVAGLYWSHGQGTVNPVNWDKELWLQFLGFVNYTIPAHQDYFYLKFSADTTVGNLASAGFGLRYNANGNTLQGQVHDGVNLSTVALGVLPPFSPVIGWFAVGFRICYQPESNRVQFWAFWNGVWRLLGTRTGGLPAGEVLGGSYVYMGVEGLTAAGMDASVNQVILYKPYA